MLTSQVSPAASLTEATYPAFQGPASSVVDTAKNFLFGRVCKDWQGTIMIAMTAMKVFFAAVNVLTGGSWLFSLFLLGAAAVDLYAKNQLDQLGTMQKQLKKQKENNDVHGLHNFVHAAQNKELAACIAKLEKTVTEQQAKQEVLNATYAETTAEQQKVVALLGGQVTANADTVATLKALQGQAGVDQEKIGAAIARLEGLKQISGQFSGAVAALGTLQGKIGAGQQGMDDAAAAMTAASTELLGHLLDLSSKKEAAAAELATRQAQLAAGAQQVEQLGTHVRDLGRVRDELQGSSRALAGVTAVAAGLIGGAAGQQPALGGPGMTAVERRQLLTDGASA